MHPTPPRNGAAPRRPRTALLIVLATIMAGCVVVAAAVGGSAPDQGRAISRLEPEPTHPVGHVIAEIRADRARIRSCRRAAYRRAHPTGCPSGRGDAVRGQRAMATGNPGATGRWAAPFQVPLWPIHQILLPTGKVLWLARGETNAEQSGHAFIYDPATKAAREITVPNVTYPNGAVKPANLWCSGHTVLADGRVLIAGGNLAYPDPAGGPGSDFKGSKWVFTFDPWTEKWTRQPDMRGGRWYPTLTTLPDGTALIVSGWDERGNIDTNPDVERFTPSPAIDGRGTLAVVAQRAFGLYPHAFVVPDATAAGAPQGTQVLYAGPNTGDTVILNTASWTWKDVPDLVHARLFGAGVLLPGGTVPRKVMLIGGYDSTNGIGSQASTEVLDLDNVGAGWKAGPTMAAGRSHLNVAILPDSSLVAIGGGAGIGSYAGSQESLHAGPVYTTERLGAGATAWGPADTQADERTYHSTGLLLPDSTVFSAGDDRDTHGPGHRTGEVWSPPYLFAGARPSLTWAPGAVRYGAPFHVTASAEGGVASVVLMHPASVTHANDMDQRLVALPGAAEPGGMAVTAPADASIAPPGWYMLFALDSRGRPSDARWIRLGADAPDAPAPPGGAPTTTGGSTVASAPGPRRTAPRRARAVPIRALVRKVMWRNGVVRLVVRVSLRKGRATRVAITVPGGGSDATRVRTYGKAGNRAVIVNTGFYGPKAWTVLSLPISIAERPGKTARGRIVITIRKGTPVAKVVPARR